METIHPKYVTFEQAKLLRDNDFQVKCKYYYELDRGELTFHIGDVGDVYGNAEIEHGYGKLSYPMVSAPEQWQVIEWLELKGIYVNVTFNTDIINSYRITIIQIVEENMTYQDRLIPTTIWKQVYEKRFAVNDRKYQFNISKYPNDSRYHRETFTKEAAISAAIDHVLKELL